MKKITFKKEELDKYPLLEKLDVGIDVVALSGSPYAELKGEIVDLNYVEEDRVTENDCIIEIIVDFYEPSVSDRNTKYSSLNETSLQDVVMSEDGEVAFCFDQSTGYQLLTGQLVCEWCLEPLKNVTETQYDYIGWDWNPEKMSYVKAEPDGDTNHKRCGNCNGRIETEYLTY